MSVELLVLVGIGSGRGSVAWSEVGQLSLAWVVTLPAAGLLAALAYWVVSRAA